MQASESFSLITNDKQKSSVKSVEASVITLERAQKLDLLIHLISNLSQSLVICGPKGIGKTTLLDQLRLRKKDVWPMCSIQATAALSFEKFQDQLARFSQKMETKFSKQELLSILSELDKQNQKIVVIIDDAGKLVPGVMTSIIQYAAASLCLRIVFSLTHDELHIKTSSDKSVDDCHFIEIPPLTEKQCGVFLQNLSAQTNASVSYGAINDRLIEKLYKETHGIPGRIISELPKLPRYKIVKSYQWGVGAIFVGVAVATGIGYFISNDSKKKIIKQEVKTALVLQQAEDVKISSPIIDSETMSWKNDIEIEQPNKAAVDLPSMMQSIKTGITRVDEVSELEEEKASPLIIEKINKMIGPEVVIAAISVLEQAEVRPEAGKAAAGIGRNKVKDTLQLKQIKKAQSGDDRQWLLEQPGKNYTIQLIVLSSRESVISFLKKNTSLKENLRFYSINKKEQKKYVLIYGSYESSELASSKMKSLPVSYRKSWVRRFKILQKEIIK